MSPRKSRKSLDDILAQQFIYGEKTQGTAKELSLKQTSSKPPSEHLSPSSRKADAPLDATEKTPNNSPLMDKFQTPPKEATIRFTVDLPASMHRKLSLLAARTGKKKAEIVRVLLDEALENVLE
ncbi:MAG TPA: hypothetical protein DCP31_23990 [Cyanobacteria bacterium UBA8543]|jgi:hypothetical protein|nr:hypothetical protein [Cyanobacteria bacterium UBA8543]